MEGPYVLYSSTCMYYDGSFYPIEEIDETGNFCQSLFRILFYILKSVDILNIDGFV